MIQVVFKQTLTMFMYMLVGFILFKTGMIEEKGSKSLANILVYFIFPVVLVKSFMREYSVEMLKGFFLGFALSLVGIVLSILVCRLIFRKDPIDSFAASFSNAGFFGVPLLIAVLGQDYVLYSLGASCLTGSIQHTYGVSLLTGKKGRFSFIDYIKAPNTVGWLIGLLIFVLHIGNKMPAIVVSFVDGISAMNAPVIMLILGSYLAKSDLKKMITNPRIYLICLVRLIIAPVAFTLLLAVIPLDKIVKLALLIPFVTACGANVAVYSQMYDKDYPYACQIVAMSTVLSIVTIPFIVTFAQTIFGL